MGAQRTFSTGEVARTTGATYRQLDYWMREGMIPGMESEVGSGSRRAWTKEQLDQARRLALASKIRGMTLVVLADMLAEVDAGLSFKPTSLDEIMEWRGR